MPYQLNEEKPYKPKTEKNRQSWGVVVDTIKAGGGKANLKDLQTALTYTRKDHEGKEVTTEHPNFIRYMIRGRHVIETKPEEKANDAPERSAQGPERRNQTAAQPKGRSGDEKGPRPGVVRP